MAARSTTTAAKLAFLRRPSSHPEAPVAIRIVETHFSWVFLGDRVVRKLKKPIGTDRLDFRRVDQRGRACRDEVLLNRALAPDIYQGVDRLVVDDDGHLALVAEAAGEGRIVDWLVRMRRLPDARALDRVSAAAPALVEAVADRLAAFYAHGVREDTGPADRRDQIEARLADLDAGLAHWPPARSVLGALHGFARDRDALLVARARDGRVVDGHGDLRPEHVYLTRPPRVIDRLEFDPRLRVVDWLEDMALLGVDLERARRSWLAAALERAVARRLNDAPPAELRAFYRVARACLRARLCLDHRARPGRLTAAGWTRRARAYLDIAHRHAEGLSRP